jgi:hypothetical protein
MFTNDEYNISILFCCAFSLNLFRSEIAKGIIVPAKQAITKKKPAATRWTIVNLLSIIISLES